VEGGDDKRTMHMRGIKEELELATEGCEGCRRDVSPFLDLLQLDPSEDLWESVLCLTSRRKAELSIADVRFSHDSISGAFLHGPHAGQPITRLVDDLSDGRVQPSTLGVEVVFWHGHFRALSNRRTWALKQWAAARDVKVEAAVLPFVRGVLTADGRDVVRKFHSSASSTTDGLSVRVR